MFMFLLFSVLLALPRLSFFVCVGLRGGFSFFLLVSNV